MTNRANERVLPVSFSRSPSPCVIQTGVLLRVILERSLRSEESRSLCHSARTLPTARANQDSASLCHSERSLRSEESRSLCHSARTLPTPRATQDSAVLSPLRVRERMRVKIQLQRAQRANQDSASASLRYSESPLLRHHQYPKRPGNRHRPRMRRRRSVRERQIRRRQINHESSEPLESAITR